ncbi:MAG TPA: AAA family ATPase [Bacteroidales bacterium]|nr:AAA family ATPase [Bacteroidales bacterium]
MEREIFEDLLKWKESDTKKPLLLRGARQVGKTYIVRKLGRLFSNFVEVNFESEPEISSFFKGNLLPDNICSKLSVYYNDSIIDGKTLLFFDEIQACPEAIKSLRFFYERRPNLHVIAAGSLLEFALKNLSSFGVGRIRSLFMYPLSFNEFLKAAGKDSLLKIKLSSSIKNRQDEIFHKKLTEMFVKFLITGGMPEVVSTYLTTDDITKTQRVLDDIIISLEDDFAKYSKRVNIARLKDVFMSILFQTGTKFNITGSSVSGNFEQKKEALEMLVMAGLCYKVYHSSANGVPLAAEKNEKKFKIIFFDTGILQRSLHLKLGDFLVADSLEMINKGNIVEQYVGLEYVKACHRFTKPELFYWQREKRGSSAEVDYLIEKNNKIIPVEVKSGIHGKMQSLFMFLKLKQHTNGIRTSLENFNSYSNIDVYPVYAIDNLFSEILE